MKGTSHSIDIMYARLKSKHNLSFTGINGTEQLSSNDYSFILNLWLVCDNMEEWDKLVIKFKKINGYE